MEYQNKAMPIEAKDVASDNDVVEQENLLGDGSIEETITKPFDPNSIDVDIATVNLGLLIDQLKMMK